MRRTMLRWMAVIALVTAVMPVQATEYLFLEYMISNHKARSNRLLERVGVDGAATVKYNDVTNVTTDYEDVRQTMDTRYGFGWLDALGLGTQALELVRQVDDYFKLTDQAFDMVAEQMDRFPEVMDCAIYIQTRNGQRIVDIYKIVAQVVTTGVKIALATNEQRFLFLDLIRQNLHFMCRDMQELIHLCMLMEHTPPMEPDTVGVDALLKQINQRAFDKANQVIDRIFEVEL